EAGEDGAVEHVLGGFVGSVGWFGGVVVMDDGHAAVEVGRVVELVFELEVVELDDAGGGEGDAVHARENGGLVFLAPAVGAGGAGAAPVLGDPNLGREAAVGVDPVVCHVEAVLEVLHDAVGAGGLGYAVGHVGVDGEAVEVDGPAGGGYNLVEEGHAFV